MKGVKSRSGGHNIFGGLAMYKASALMFAAFMAVATPAFSQQEPTPSQKLAAAAFDIVKDVRTKQELYCKNPRSYASPVCNADFERARLKLIIMVGWQIMLNVALGEGDQALVSYLQKKQEAAKTEAVETQRELQGNFYPIPRASTLDPKQPPMLTKTARVKK